MLLTEAGFPLNKTEKLAEAKTLLTEVLDYSAANGDKWWAKTADEWGKMWLHENDNKYFIFEMQYTNTIEQGNPITIYSSPIYYDNSYSRKLGIYMNDRVAAMYRSVDTETGEQKFIDNRGQYILDPDYTDYIWKWTECDAKGKLSDKILTVPDAAIFRLRILTQNRSSKLSRPSGSLNFLVKVCAGTISCVGVSLRRQSRICSNIT